MKTPFILAIERALEVDPFLSREHGIAFATESNTKTFGATKAVFNRTCPHVVADAELARRVIQFQIGFINKNEEHIAFFGGVLTGVQVVRFTEQDRGRFFTDVVQINDIEVEEQLHTVPAIVPTRNVSADVFNHTCLWLVHMFLTSKHLTPEVRQRAALAAALILQYRFLTSILMWYYKYPADPQVAAASYAQLSNKYAIKQAGSWQKLLEIRSMDLIKSPKEEGGPGLHYNTCYEYENDDKIVYALNDNQGRIREIMKNLIAELKRVSAQGVKVRSTSAEIELDGEVFLRDKVKSLASYTTYLHSIISDKYTFIKYDILDILAEAMYTSPPAMVEQVLSWCTANYRTRNGKEIEELIDMTMVHSFGYLQDNRTVLKETTDLTSLIVRLKGVYTSARSTEVNLMKMRDLSEAIVRKATTTKNASLVSSLKTSLMLYLVIRAFTMTHYGVKR